MKLFNVVAVNLHDHTERIIATGMTEKEAEAIVIMAVIRRGVEEECFKSVEATS